MKTTFCVNLDVSCTIVVYGIQINRNITILLEKLTMFKTKKIQNTLKLERKSLIQTYVSLKLWPKSFYLQFAIIQVHICIIQ